MNAVRNEIARYFIMQQSPTDWTGRPVMQRRHGVHEVGHVPRPGLPRLLKHVDCRASVTDRDHPTAFAQLPDEFDTTANLWSYSGHAHHFWIIANWKIVYLTSRKGAKVLRP